MLYFYYFVCECQLKNPCCFLVAPPPHTLRLHTRSAHAPPRTRSAHDRLRTRSAHAPHTTVSTHAPHTPLPAHAPHTTVHKHACLQSTKAQLLVSNSCLHSAAPR